MQQEPEAVREVLRPYTFPTTAAMKTQCAYTFDPANHEETSVTEPWECPHDTVGTGEYCQFHMDPSQRDAAGISDVDVVDDLTQILKEGDPEKREFLGATLPKLSLAYVDIEGSDQHPIDLRHTTITEGIVATHGRFEEQLDLRHSTLGGLKFDNCTFENGVLCAGVTVTGGTDLFEAVVTGDDADFSDVRFAGQVSIDEADFQEDACFAGATFEDAASFLGADFYGRSNDIGDNTTFAGTVFEDYVTFEHASFKHTCFKNAKFRGDATFENATVAGGCLFTESEFEASADFDEGRFRDDVSFAEASFVGPATFRGVEFEGGAAVLDDDTSFENADFGEDVVFRNGRFSYANFTKTDFEGDADFERTKFTDDAVFEGTVFSGMADFDEVVFDADADFTNTTFRRTAVFRGCEFRGGTNYLEDDAVFERAVFGNDADFRDTLFESASFVDAAFEGNVDFTESEFTDSLRLRASSFGEKTYFNFTEAEIADGTIIQPESGWIRFDMTKATLGTVNLRAADPEDERELLDYFRICDTTFEGFDFAAHLGYLDRNDWRLHTFDAGDHGYEFAEEMTPEMIEKTYLEAKNSASEESNIKAAGEFRVKRQQFARRKFYRIAGDSQETVGTRFRNLLRGVENLFLGVSCGYGLRLYRITGVFVVFPLLVGFLFAFGGEPFATSTDQLSSFGELTTSDGLHTLMINIYFSYITFLTIGYGGIGPEGIAARFTAAGLVYMNVILAGLFLYALIKRSEV